MQWREIGAASYYKGFVSWLLQSYKMDVYHRFTQVAQLSIQDLRYGNLIAEHINRVVLEINCAE